MSVQELTLRFVYLLIATSIFVGIENIIILYTNYDFYWKSNKNDSAIVF